MTTREMHDKLEKVEQMRRLGHAIMLATESARDAYWEEVALSMAEDWGIWPERAMQTRDGVQVERNAEAVDGRTLETLARQIVIEGPIAGPDVVREVTLAELAGRGTGGRNPIAGWTPQYMADRLHRRLGLR